MIQMEQNVKYLSTLQSSRVKYSLIQLNKIDGANYEIDEVKHEIDGVNHKIDGGNHVKQSGTLQYT